MEYFQERWDQFIAGNPAGSFLQSYDWGIFQKNIGRGAWCVVLTDTRTLRFPLSLKKRYLQKENEKWLLSALILTHELPLKGKKYLYSPRGPIINFLSFGKKKPIALLEKFLKEGETIAKKEGAVFFRMDPEWLDGKELADFMGRFKLKKSSKEIQPRRTLIVDLIKTEDEILAVMHEKTRYNIRLADRKGVSVSRHHVVKTEDFEESWGLLKETARRDKFRFHKRAYYEGMLTLGGTVPLKGDCPPSRDLVVELFTARYKGKLLAANIVAFFGKRATYLHGASSDEHRNVMAPYLLQWGIMKEAKKRGCTEYDLWGISEKNWPGVTRFKKGFGGHVVSYVGAYDYPFSKFWYRAYVLGTSVRRVIPV